MSRRWCAVLVLIPLAGCGDPPLPHVDGLEVGLNDDNFQSEVLNHEQPVLVDFGATWCGPCRKMDPVIAHASLNYEGRIKFGKVDVDRNRRLASEYDVGGIPALVLFHKGQEIDRAVGYHSLSDLSQWLDNHAPNPATN
jgi:thioredoxin